MHKLYVCGDTHGHIDIDKLRPASFASGLSLSKSDFVLIAGDAGILWEPLKNNTSLDVDWFDAQPWTTLWIDGNHENFDTLAIQKRVKSIPGVTPLSLTLYLKQTPSGKSIYHLRRGGIYDIGGKIIFVMGGGVSIDKARRRNRVSWWEEELPSYAEMKFGLDNLKDYFNDSVRPIDAIVTHTCPMSLRRNKSFINSMYSQVGNYKVGNFGEDSLNNYLDEVWKFIESKQKEPFDWFFGHFHIDSDIVYDKKESVIDPSEEDYIEAFDHNNVVTFHARYISPPDILER